MFGRMVLPECWSVFVSQPEIRLMHVHSVCTYFSIFVFDIFLFFFRHLLNKISTFRRHVVYEMKLYTNITHHHVFAQHASFVRFSCSNTNIMSAMSSYYTEIDLLLLMSNFFSSPRHFELSLRCTQSLPLSNNRSVTSRIYPKRLLALISCPLLLKAS